MTLKNSVPLLVLATVLFSACGNKDPFAKDPPAVNINFIFKFDSTQIRLNSFGAADTVPAGHGAQSPRFNTMSAHYLELTRTIYTPLGQGTVLYRADEVAPNGVSAIDFSKAKFAANGEVFLSVPLSTVTTGSYAYLRVSLAYQNYNVYLDVPNPVSPAQTLTLDGTFASFIGYNTFIGSFKIKDSTVVVNDSKKQGYWAFETQASGYGFVLQGQAPPGATTVPNPLFATSGVPNGSCVVTGAFATPLVIRGNETADINVEVSLSTNKSFEWKETDGNNRYNPLSGDTVIDMGIRGMMPKQLL